MIEAVLFDLGETLIHIDSSFKPRLKELRLADMMKFLSSKRLPIGKKDFKLMFEEIAHETTVLVEEQSVEAAIQEVFAKTLHRLGVRRFDGGFLESLEKAFYRREVDSWMLFDHAKETLEQFQGAGFKLGLVSNTRSDWQVRETIRGLDIGKYFRAVVTSAQVGVRKPRPEPFLKALEILGSSPEEAVMVGDTLETDILGASVLGIKTIYVRRREETASIRSDTEIESLIEAYPIVEKLRMRGSTV